MQMSLSYSRHSRAGARDRTRDHPPASVAHNLCAMRPSRCQGPDGSTELVRAQHCTLLLGVSWRTTTLYFLQSKRAEAEEGEIGDLLEKREKKSGGEGGDTNLSLSLSFLSLTNQQEHCHTEERNYSNRQPASHNKTNVRRGRQTERR